MPKKPPLLCLILPQTVIMRRVLRVLTDLAGTTTTENQMWELGTTKIKTHHLRPYMLQKALKTVGRVKYAKTHAIKNQKTLNAKNIRPTTLSTKNEAEVRPSKQAVPTFKTQKTMTKARLVANPNKRAASNVVAKPTQPKIIRLTRKRKNNRPANSHRSKNLPKIRMAEITSQLLAISLLNLASKKEVMAVETRRPTPLNSKKIVTLRRRIRRSGKNKRAKMVSGRTRTLAASSSNKIKA